MMSNSSVNSINDGNVIRVETETSSHLPIGMASVPVSFSGEPRSGKQTPTMSLCNLIKSYLLYIDVTKKRGIVCCHCYVRLPQVFMRPQWTFTPFLCGGTPGSKETPEGNKIEQRTIVALEDTEYVNTRVHQCSNIPPKRIITSPLHPRCIFLHHQ